MLGARLLHAILRPAIQHLLDSLLEYLSGVHRTLLRFRPRDHHFPLGENERSSFGLSDTHYDSWEATWIIHSVAAAHGDFAQVEPSAVEVGRRHQVLQRRWLQLTQLLPLVRNELAVDM